MSSSSGARSYESRPGIAAENPAGRAAQLEPPAEFAAGLEQVTPVLSVESLRFAWPGADAPCIDRGAAFKIGDAGNPDGGAAIARERNLWGVSDEAYEDVVFNGEHISIASLKGMAESMLCRMRASCAASARSCAAAIAAGWHATDSEAAPRS